jgi:aryl-alcohol dehydrogenase-like predicted oxidoreductase
LGTVKFGRNQQVKNFCGDGFPLPSDETVDTLMGICQDHGVNLLDTAPAYGSAEDRLGRALQGRRASFFLMTKTGEQFNGESSEYSFTRQDTVHSVERSLRALRTDYLDCVFVHCNKDDLQILNDTAVIETLQELKKAGKVRCVGFSSFSVAGGLAAIGRVDALMVPFNAEYQEHLPVVKAAAQAGLAVIAKKGLGSGKMAQGGGYVRCFEAIASTAEITAITVGTIDPGHLRENIQSLWQSLAGR